MEMHSGNVTGDMVANSSQAKDMGSGGGILVKKWGSMRLTPLDIQHPSIALQRLG